MSALLPSWLNDPAITRLLQALTAEGAEVRFVGGCVRDWLLGQHSDDLDLATTSKPEDTQRLLEQAGIHAIPTGIQHGTITAIVEHRPFEITTLRCDIACDGRHAEVAFTDNWEEDAARRDFTINALSLAPDGTLYDYFDGQRDLAAGHIRFIGNADERIREDGLRILRFFRFYARYGTPPPDATALAACKQQARMLDQLSGERIQAEMKKLLISRGAVEAIQLMAEYHIISHLLPTFVGTETLSTLAAIEAKSGRNPDPILRLATLLEHPKKTDTSTDFLGNRWKLSRRDSDYLRLLLTTSCPTADATLLDWQRFIRAHGNERAQQLILFFQACVPNTQQDWDSINQLAREWTAPSFPISGRDLLDKGFAAGKELGETLARLETDWEKSGFTLTREALLARA